MRIAKFEPEIILFLASWMGFRREVMVMGGTERKWILTNGENAGFLMEELVGMHVV